MADKVLVDKQKARAIFAKYRERIADLEDEIDNLNNSLQEYQSSYYELESRTSHKTQQLQRELSKQKQQAEWDSWEAERKEKQLKAKLQDAERYRNYGY